MCHAVILFKDAWAYTWAHTILECALRVGYPTCMIKQRLAERNRLT